MLFHTKARLCRAILIFLCYLSIQMESYLHQSPKLIIFCLRYLIQLQNSIVSNITLILVECKPRISINHMLCELQSLFSIFYVLPPPSQFLIISFSLQRSLLISYHLTVGGLTSPIPIKSLFETRKHSDHFRLLDQQSIWFLRQVVFTFRVERLNTIWMCLKMTISDLK